MTGWRRPFAALVLWAVHFFGAYGLMLAFPEAPFVRWLTVGLGLACLAVLAMLLRPAPRQPGLVTAATLSGIAIIWQSIVGLF